MLLLGFLWLPGQSLGGAIKGKVVFVGANPAPKKLEVTIDQYVCGAEKEENGAVYAECDNAAERLLLAVGGV